MRIIRLILIANLVFGFVMGCSEKKGKLINQSQTEAKSTQKELIDNWSDFYISYNSMVIVFDPKNDGKKILGLKNRGGSMTRPTIIWCCLFIILVYFGLIGCAGSNRGKLNTVEKPTESELEQDWKEYTVYHLRDRFNLALVYKIKDDREIILDSRWIKVSSEEAMTSSIVSQPTWVNEIMGNNDEIFGYLVIRSADRATIKIIDQNKVQLYYHIIGYRN